MESNSNVLKKLADCLSRRDYAPKELKEKLLPIFDEEAVDQAIATAQAKSWIKPLDELSQNIYRQLNQKNQGILAINYKLQQKDLPLIKKEEQLEIKKAENSLAKKYQNKTSFNHEQKQKACRFLNQKGFDEETIYQVVHPS